MPVVQSRHVSNGFLHDRRRVSEENTVTRRIREIYGLGLFDERPAFLDIRALLREPR